MFGNSLTSALLEKAFVLNPSFLSCLSTDSASTMEASPKITIYIIIVLFFFHRENTNPKYEILITHN
jgi:hypothetical protein